MILVLQLIVYVAAVGLLSGASPAEDREVKRSVKLNNYNNWWFQSSTKTTKKEKLEVVARRDSVCFTESWPVRPAEIKALNPNAKVYRIYDLCCKNAWDSDWQHSLDTTRMQTPLTRRMIDSADWWLRDGKGRIAKENERTWLLDVGKPGFKEAYLEAVLSRIEGKGFDGVVFDYLWPSASSLQRNLKVEGLQDYPSDDDWFYDAWKPFFEYVVTGLHKAGYRVIGNCVGEYGTSDLLKNWQRSKVDGAIYEQWAVDWPKDGKGDWLEGHRVEIRIKAMHEDPLEVWTADLGVQSSDPAYEQKKTVSLAMYYVALPVGKERSYHHFRDRQVYWDDLWDFCIGEPLEQASKTPGRYFWSRKFTHGIVLLNYESQETINFSLDGKYRNPAGERVTGEISIPPHTALILANEEQ